MMALVAAWCPGQQRRGPMSVEVRDSYDAIAELYASLNLDALDQYTQRLWVPD